MIKIKSNNGQDYKVIKGKCDKMMKLNQSHCLHMSYVCPSSGSDSRKRVTKKTTTEEKKYQGNDENMKKVTK